MEAAVTTKRAETTCSDGGGGMAALPVELLHEIFRRVGSLKDLFLFAVTCRRWLRLFTDPAFLIGLCSGHQGHRARLLGFFFRPTRLVHCDRMLRMRNEQRTSVSPPTFRPSPWSPLGPTDIPLTSFIADDGGAFNYAEPLAARRGFVLVQLVPPTFNLERIRDDTVPLLVAVFNPITGERHVPPAACVGRHAVHGCAIVTTADDGDLDGKASPTFSQLLLITRRTHAKGQWQLRSYTAATCSWSTRTLLPDDAGGGGGVGGSAVVHQGAAHWLFMHYNASTRDYDKVYKLSVELGTASVSMAKLPVRVEGTPLLCVGRDGQLMVAGVYPFHVTVWTQQQDGDAAAWLRTQVIPAPAMAVGDLRQQEVWYEFGKGTLIVLDRGGGVFILDLEKKVMEKAMDCYPSLPTSDGRISYIPYEMDLVDFFVSRLGGLCRG
ncbi:hypothetical protein HU200_064718 [Digitaria exilis]|uniref:F-box domain-containing protein n=1 Tax=Digitaria exilis TaxID=1010633 RepID=A0A835DUC1_9POAL|nr:hypothetical protein HU200_064718 [Digitaria exilis]